MLIMPYRLAHARILIVDDSRVSLTIITEALSKAGFQTIEKASDGLEAVEKTRIFKPDLVILDIRMPKLDGFGYCEQARKDSDIPHMPIIVQTALEDRETKLRALSSGADDFLNKPADPIELSLRARVHLERYFMLEDMRNMCDYLKMELDQAQSVMRQMSDASVSNKTMHMLNRHYEVLEAMTVLPSVTH